MRIAAGHAFEVLGARNNMSLICTCQTPSILVSVLRTHHAAATRAAHSGKAPQLLGAEGDYNSVVGGASCV